MGPAQTPPAGSPAKSGGLEERQALPGPAVLVVLLVLDPQVGAAPVGLELHVAVAAPVLAAILLPQVVVAVPGLHAGAVAVVGDREAAVVVAAVAHAVAAVPTAPVAAAEDVTQGAAAAVVSAAVPAIGRGAGGDATGAAVVSDLVEIARDLAAGRLSAKNVVGFLESRELELAAEPKPAGWYLRLTVGDEPGIIARVAEVLAREGMNIDSVQQEPHSPKERLSLFFTVEPVSEPNVRRAVEKINDFPFMVEESLVAFLDQSSRFLAPVFAGDTLYPALVIDEVSPGRTTGIIGMQSTILNQNRVKVMEGRQRYLLRKKPA